jgi:sortase A
MCLQPRLLSLLLHGFRIGAYASAGTFKYRVISLRVVLPSAIEVFNDTQLPTLTLVTCYPFDFMGTAPQRLIVHAEIVSDSPNRIH